jgi:hypothetical protein
MALLAFAACDGGGGEVAPDAAEPVVYSRCPQETRATPESLAQKAAAYDARVLGLHAHPRMPWVVDVVVAPGTDPETATHDDVVAWWSGENDGLFSGLVMAAEAYRFAVTHDPAARETLATLLDGERMRMDITGVPGLFTRQLIPPGITGLQCPTDPAMYVPAADKRGNKWVRIGQGGCAEVADDQGAFHATTHCGLQRFAGWCFLDNISQDEYVGHLLALGTIAKVVDDAELRGQALDMLEQIGEHLAAHEMAFVDWDGRTTQWGKVYPGAPGDTPGYLAVLGMAFAATAGAEVPAWESYFDQIDQWIGPDGCGANWNNLSMLAASFHLLLWNTPGAAVRDAFAQSLVAPLGTSRGILAQHNAWYDLMWAAHAEEPAYAAVEDAVCQLRQFPRSNHVVARDTSALAPEACTDRQDNSLAAAPFAIADRCAATFAYWGNPYERSSCADEPALIHQPGGYLLPYWMGRYHGFIPADL